MVSVIGVATPPPTAVGLYVPLPPHPQTASAVIEAAIAKQMFLVRSFFMVLKAIAKSRENCGSAAKAWGQTRSSCNSGAVCHAEIQRSIHYKVGESQADA